MTTKKHPLAEHAVLEFVNHKIVRQGTIKDVFDGLAMVQLYDWVIGLPTDMMLLPLTVINGSDENGWKLFADDERRNCWYERNYRRYHGTMLGDA